LVDVLDSSKPGVELQRLPASEQAELCVRLWTVAKAREELAPLSLQAHAAENGVASRGRRRASQHLEGGRLAGAVDAQQAEALALPHPEAHPLHGRESAFPQRHAKLLLQPVYREDWTP
jgi:hypothetical protein